jgi:hypothetical protein
MLLQPARKEILQLSFDFAKVQRSRQTPLPSHSLMNAKHQNRPEEKSGLGMNLESGKRSNQRSGLGMNLESGKRSNQRSGHQSDPDEAQSSLGEVDNFSVDEKSR